MAPPAAAKKADAPKRLGIDVLTYRSVKRARDMFLSEHTSVAAVDESFRNTKMSVRGRAEYSDVIHIPAPATIRKDTTQAPQLMLPGNGADGKSATSASKLVGDAAAAAAASAVPAASGGATSSALALVKQAASDKALALKAPSMPKPQWHPQWKLMRVIQGHEGWVRCIAVEPGNQWFVTGSADRTIKIWDLASGTRKLSLTGHIATVRGVAVSPRHPYLFSCGEDKMVKCWDLETNMVIRHYHGHLSAVYCLALHPTLDVLMTGGRDSSVRVWDMRTKSQVHCLTGHTNTVSDLLARSTDPQVISASHDSTVRTWDLTAGKSMCTLTNHKKSVRALVQHPRENTFTSASPDNIKQWYLPEGKFIQNLQGHNAVVNSMACNSEGVLVSGADNGSLSFWDYRTGYRFQQSDTIVQPGSLDSEAGIFDMTFDKSGSRLITCEADKTIKVYKEDPASTEATHPVKWKPTMMKKARF
eukprot:m.180051 g.180051  ORF g.180051 m.180051 type:complete len:474 (+) comp18408_c0_seq6:214-1635(+)